MPTKPSVLPEWATNDLIDGVNGLPNKTPPTTEFKASGLNRGENLTRQHLNYQLNLINEWIEFFEGGAQNVYPEVQTADNKLAITDNLDGTVTIDASQNFTLRGTRLFSTDSYTAVQRTLTHTANNTYHIRFTEADGFSIVDTTDVTYNPSADPETDSKFDSTFDDMLIARVVTDGGNNATITELANAEFLVSEQNSNGGATHLGSFLYRYDDTFTLDWARSPNYGDVYAVVSQGAGSLVNGGANYNRNNTKDRYQVYIDISTDWDTAAGSVIGNIQFTVFA